MVKSKKWAKYKVIEFDETLLLMGFETAALENDGNTMLAH